MKRTTNAALPFSWWRPFGACALLAVASCSAAAVESLPREQTENPAPDARVADASDGPDATAEADAGGEAGTDASEEAAVDAGPACDVGLTLCGDTCVDTQTDNANCGGCGLSCASCTTGACVETIFSDGGAIVGLAVDDTRAYWVDFLHFDVTSARLDGSDVTTIATDQVYPKDVAVHGDFLYWATAGAGVPYGTIMRSALDGSAPASIASASGVTRLAVTSTHAFWTEWGTDRVMTVSLVDGTPTVFATAQTWGPLAITVLGDFVYWIENGGAVVKAPIGGGDAHVLASGVAPGSVMTAHGNSIYWSSGFGVNKLTPR